MLLITIPSAEYYNEPTEEFVNVGEQRLCLEHSLVSLSKWEAKWHKPFFSTQEKTYEESVDYIRCMTVTQNVNSIVYQYLPPDVIKQVSDYIDDPMTATWFVKEDKPRPSREAVTSELIYYWMISCGIPMECQKWHLNRLFTLIRVCGIKSRKPKKMGKRELMSRNRALNAERRSKLNSRG